MIKFSTAYLTLTPLPVEGLLQSVRKLRGIPQRLPPKRDYVGNWSIGGAVRSLKRIRKNVAWLMISYMLLNKHIIVRKSRTIRIIRNFCFQPSTSCLRLTLTAYILAAPTIISWQMPLLIFLLRRFQNYVLPFWVPSLILELHLVCPPLAKWIVVLFINCSLG